MCVTDFISPTPENEAMLMVSSLARNDYFSLPFI